MFPLLLGGGTPLGNVPLIASIDALPCSRSITKIIICFDSLFVCLIYEKFFLISKIRPFDFGDDFLISKICSFNF